MSDESIKQNGTQYIRADLVRDCCPDNWREDPDWQRLVESVFPDIAGDAPGPDIRGEDKPTADECQIFDAIASQVQELQPDDQQAMLATFAAYTYRLARLQGASHYEALAGVYHSGMRHIQEAEAALAQPEGSLQ